MKIPHRFIVVDDDLINNMLCRVVIKGSLESLDILTFTLPEAGFDFIVKEYSEKEIPTVLLLDINMPTWSGWDFLEQFDKLDVKIKNQIKIYMLSSSVDPGDKQRARDNQYVIDYIEKPLQERTVLSILEVYHERV